MPLPTHSRSIEEILSDQGLIINKEPFQFLIQPDDSLVLIDYMGEDTQLKIPASVDSHPVTALGVCAFSDNDTLIEIELPHTLEIIEDDCFNHCQLLERISAPADIRLKSIGPGASEGCSKLMFLPIFSQLETMGSFAFRECTALQDFVYSPRLQYLGDYAFHGCTALDWAEIPNDIKNIGEGIFSHCFNIKQGEVPWLTDRMFFGCKELISLKIRRSSPGSCQDALYGCNALQEISYPLGFNTEEIAALRKISSLPESVICREESAAESE